MIQFQRTSKIGLVRPPLMPVLCMARFTICFLLASIAVQAWADDDTGIKEIRAKKDVEVAPGKWLTMDQVDRVLDEESQFVKRLPNRQAVEKMRKEESTELTIPWKSLTVSWKGSGIPVSLREFNGSLFLITFDRSQEVYQLRYYVQKEAAFDAISPADYPKQIATQNLWFKDRSRYSVGTGGRKVDQVELAVNIDPDDIYFTRTLTATIWCELATGKSYQEVERLGHDEKKKIVNEYSEKYSPIKLTQIIRSNERK